MGDAMRNLLLLLIIAGLLAGCSVRYTRKTEICANTAPPTCTTVKDSAGVELEKN